VKVAECIESYNRFVSHVEDLDLVGVGDAKAILTVLICFIPRIGNIQDSVS